MRRGVIMKFKFRLAGVTVLATREIIGCINASGLTVNVTASDAFASAGGDLARMLISGEKQGEYTEGQKKRARRRIGD
jgi:hypothetical protein